MILQVLINLYFIFLIIFWEEVLKRKGREGRRLTTGRRSKKGCRYWKEREEVKKGRENKHVKRREEEKGRREVVKGRKGGGRRKG